VVIAGSERTTRRRGSRRPRDPSFFRFGPELRQARERLGLTPETVSDRTGVRRLFLESLEEGDLSCFPDEKAAMTAVRRCAEVLALDPGPMVQTVGEQWQNVAHGTARDTVTAGAGRLAAPSPVPPPAPAPTADGGHLSRYPGDTSHLKAFTQTAQVPQVRARAVVPAPASGPTFDTTDAIPVTWRGPRPPDPAPTFLRVALWTTALLLTLGVAAEAIHHWRPAWLADIHLVGSGAGPAAPVSSPAPRSHPAVHAALATETSTGPTSATVAIRASVFEVVVTTQAPCWIHVTSPASFAPVFSATVPAGTTKTFTSARGQLSVELGASHATVTAQILGRTIPGWTLAPTQVPFVISFHAAAS
jgi:hypothetical protein